ncbi:hypothetical protein KGQ19_00335 [Catenulispora sp. NL8]|uniref:Uncharacterized protein n=1 Tax=Catenulispora pinistramenti TaxID=2705254 RepID=A0ABS5KHE9_9ACTN|nr:hypothetical protein [Catenulispora pinistramenti]MBS2545305.1 hypothetical protein [Catenulispora pinistramenti]
MISTSFSEDDPPPEQNNHGSGTFIGRDNYGPIQAVDAKTKELLAKILVEAPALGKLLERALREGVISPDIASAISYAAHSINEDVAASLYVASRRINEDVADS